MGIMIKDSGSETSVRHIEEQALIARNSFELGEISAELLRELYLKYNPEVEIDGFLVDAARLFPHLNCGLASVYLQHSLGRGDVIHGRYNGHPHTVLSLGELVVDITADQFGGPAIYVGPLVTPWLLPER